ncbi:hypothetical protein [Paenibacillus sp. NEAU-GSW1]|uniref:hypothetical protein n=1 Tax=Paenibacillus sp. NEAU-GSW1 TaxID=2682486 RepID=UPI0012E122AD|nr:hypothetical protein [Paenibacillus sp. NEAU-GSW1]MUT66584.1 hypothetical protein [Paenibacillus sp. NEAU-GSW1]
MKKRTAWVASTLAVLLALGGGVGAGYANAETAAAPDKSAAAAERGQGGKHLNDRKGGFSAFGKLQDEIASYLGLELTELHAQLQEATLAEVALANGVSRENMRAKLVELIEAERAEHASKAAANDEATDATDTTATGSTDKKIQPLDSGALADKLLDAKGGFAGKGLNGSGDGRHGGGFGHFGNSEVLTELLGLTAEELQAAIKEGKTLAAIAAEQGVDVQKVIDLLVSEETKRLDQALADGKITQAQYDEKKAALTEQATKRVNETKPAGEPGGRGKHGGFGGCADKSASSETADSAAAADA